VPFVWLGTRKTFDAFTFAFEQTEHGWFQAHAYKFDDETSTFIVETPQAVWKAHGLDSLSQEDAVAFCERCLPATSTAMPSSATPRTCAARPSGSASRGWCARPGCTANTMRTSGAHRADGRRCAYGALLDWQRHQAGTRRRDRPGRRVRHRPRHGADDLDAVLQGLRSPPQCRGAEDPERRAQLHRMVRERRALQRHGVEQFAYSLLTRSQRISHENLRLRDAKWLEGYEAWLAGGKAVPPMLTPLKVRTSQLKNRMWSHPWPPTARSMAWCKDFHLVHLGARALGGAALVFVEMTSPTPEGRITPGCPGLWNDAQQAAFKRIVGLCPRSRALPDRPCSWATAAPRAPRSWGGSYTTSRCRAAPTGRCWPPARGLWRAEPGAPGHDGADMDRHAAAFVDATRRAAEAGFDWLELHCAHGYLLSSFITPLTNLRTDDYGGSLDNRCRYPLEVFRAMRAVWPAGLPMSVRISAHDWAPGGNTADDAVAVARLFKDAGCDFDRRVVRPDHPRQAKPVYGRMYQTPFADRIRNEVGIPPLPWAPSARPTTPTASLPPAVPTCAPLPAPPGRPGLDAARSRKAGQPRRRMAPPLPERPRPAVP
jgi:anthraniloyl-CoA monooxygenase